MKTIALLLLASAQTASLAAQAPSPSSAHAVLPSDWSNLAELRLVRRPPVNPAVSDFVRDEVSAGRCATVTRSSSGTMLTIDLALLVGVGGHVKRIVPRAIDCVTVEQYAAGLVSRVTRDNVDASGLTADTWLRTTMIFAWAG